MTIWINQSWLDLFDQQGLLNSQKEVVPSPSYNLKGIKSTTTPVRPINVIQNSCVVGIPRIVRKFIPRFVRQTKMLICSNEKIPFGFPNVDGVAPIARKTIEDFRA